MLNTLAEVDREVSSLGSSLAGLSPDRWHAPADVRRESDRYVIELDLPGGDPASLDVTLADGLLTVKAERSATRDANEEGWLVHERNYASVVRRVGVGDDVDPDAITADYTDGALTLALPLAAQVEPRKIALTRSRR